MCRRSEEDGGEEQPAVFPVGDRAVHRLPQLPRLDVPDHDRVAAALAELNAAAELESHAAASDPHHFFGVGTVVTGKPYRHLHLTAAEGCAAPGEKVCSKCRMCSAREEEREV